MPPTPDSVADTATASTPDSAPTDALDRAALKALLPHRAPMLLLDRAWTDDDNTAHGQLYITGDEYFLQGHFPDNPVVPGVISCEILAQTCCVLLTDHLGTTPATPLFTGLDKVKFRRPIRPRQTITTTVRLTRSRPPFYKATGTAHVAGELCLQAELSFALMQAGQEAQDRSQA